MTEKVVSPPKFSLIRKTLILFGCMFVLQLLYVGTVVTMVEQTRLQVAQQQDARRVLSSIGRVLRSVQDLNILVGKAELLGVADTRSAYEHQLESLNKDVRALKAALANQPRYAETVNEVELTSKKIPEVYEQFRQNKKGTKGLQFHLEDKVMKMGGRDMEWVRIYMSSSEVLARLEAIQQDYRQVENDAQEHLKFQSSLLFNATLFMGFIATVIVAFLLYHIFISGIVGRLKQVGRTLDDIAVGKRNEVLIDSTTDDEIGALVSSLQSMERSLRNIRSKEKALLENSASCICSIDEQGRFVKVSNASTIRWGVEPDELLGTPLTSLIVESDRQVVEEKLDELFRTGQPVDFECGINGQSTEFSWTASFAEDRNLAVCVAHDVTTRNETIRQIKQRESQFRNIVDCMPIAVVTCDQLNAISSINPATQEMLKYSAQDLLGKKLSVLLFGGTKFGITSSEQISEILATTENRSVELVVSRADGSRLPVEFNSRHYELNDAQVHLATFKDVSARFEIETVKKEFVAMISHDLRSPLTAVHGTLEVICYDNERSAGSLSPDDVDSAGEVTQAQQIVFSTVNVLNDFLDLEKFEAGLVSLELQDVTLSVLVSALLDKLHSENNSVELLLEANEGLLLSTISADIERISFAICTIVLVANRFARSAQRGQLVLAISRSDQNLNLAIRNGDIPQHVELALISHYAFLSDAALDGVVSSGLSVSLSRAILGAHGGSVRIDRSNDACQVSIALPIRRL